MDKYQEALDRIKNKKAIIDGEKMTIGTAYCNTFPILQELINNYAKYKRAFEILKEVVNIANLDGTYLLSVWVNTLTPICYLKKEQGELLEELIGNEKKN